VEFRLLGPLEVSDHGRALELGGQKRRALLALLLLHANEVVSSDRLIEELWGEEPPQAAATALHGHVSRLRKLLGGDGGSEQLLVTRPPGYMLRVEPEQVDLHRFERLRGEARAARVKGDLAGASKALQAALSLWSGPPLGGLAYERFAQTEVNRLEELRLATIEERIEVDLALGRHGDLISELEHLVSEHRFREGLRGQLMLALYRSGRQAEALQVYQQARTALVEELGIEPGQPLRELQQAILRQDESLDAPGEPALPQAGVGRKQDAAPPAQPPPRPKATRRRLALPLAVACAIGGAVALGLLLPRVFEANKAHAAYRSGTVLVDLKTRKQIGFVRPSQLDSPAFPVYSGGHFWLMNLTTSTFVEIDPKTGRVLHQFPLPRGARDTPFAVAGRTLWISAGDDLVKVDTTLGLEFDRLHLDKIVGAKGPAKGVAAGGGLIWVGRDVGPGQYPLGQVVAIDPHTRKVRYRFDHVVHHTNLAYASGTVWSADDAGVDVIDPNAESVTPVRGIETEDPFYGPGSGGGSSVAAGGGFGWATDSARGVVYRIDRNGREVPYHTGLGANGASFRDGVLWARSEDEGTVIAIDAVTGDKTVYRFGHPVGAEVAGGGILLAALGPGRTTEDSIAALKGNVLRLFSKQGALGQGSEPALNWDFAANQIEFATCAQLLNFPDKAAPDGSRVRPEVATAMPTLSGDGRTYTFRVRRGYAFSPPSGQPVTAETFRYSIERALSPKLGFGPGPFSVSDIQGEQAFRNGKADHISGLRAAGDRLSITLTKPSPGLPYHMADPAFCPVPIRTRFIPGGANRRVGDAGDYSMPSAGPYYVAAWRNEKYVILKRNPNYHGPRPHALDSIVLREGLDATVALDRIRHGGWDGIVSSGHTGAELTDPLLDPTGGVAARYGKTSSSHDQYVAPRMPHVGFLILNAVRGPFTDRTVRRAAALALDRAEIARVWGNMVPADQLLPPVAAGFHERNLYPLDTPDLRAAAALMHGRRFDVVMGVFRDALAIQQGRLVRAELDQIGLRVKLITFPDEETFNRILDRGGEIDLVDGGLFASIDGADFLESAVTVGGPGAAPRRFLTQKVRSEVKRVTRLTGKERWSAAGRLADRLAAYDVPLIAYGNRVEDELFAPTVGCRVFPPESYGVDLAALCRKGSG
jgi:DNA-binding SARP family transcriptional activator/ABC-type transport system substrate-binding protein/outer membrane protein assembly factor BamB